MLSSHLLTNERRKEFSLNYWDLTSEQPLKLKVLVKRDLQELVFIQSYLTEQVKWDAIRHKRRKKIFQNISDAASKNNDTKMISYQTSYSYSLRRRECWTFGIRSRTRQTEKLGGKITFSITLSCLLHSFSSNRNSRVRDIRALSWYTNLGILNSSESLGFRGNRNVANTEICATTIARSFCLVTQISSQIEFIIPAL